MNPSSKQLFDRLRPAIALFADVWGVPVPMATAWCQDGASVMADKLVYQTTPYRFKKSTLIVLKKPLTLTTLMHLKRHALPQSFFGRRELDGWHTRHPNAPVERTLCLLGLMLLSLVRYQGVLCVGQPMILSDKKTLPLKTKKLNDTQKAWVFVAVFLTILGLVIWQSLPEPPPKPVPPPKIHQKIPDVAIVRIDENRD